MRGWYGEYEPPGVHSEAFPEQDEKSEGGQVRENGPEDASRLALSLSFLVVPQKRFTVLAIAKRFSAAGAARGETGADIAVCKAVLKIGPTNELI